MQHLSNERHIAQWGVGILPTWNAPSSAAYRILMQSFNARRVYFLLFIEKVLFEIFFQYFGFSGSSFRELRALVNVLHPGEFTSFINEIFFYHKQFLCLYIRRRRWTSERFLLRSTVLRRSWFSDVFWHFLSSQCCVYVRRLGSSLTRWSYSGGAATVLKQVLQWLLHTLVIHLLWLVRLLSFFFLFILLVKCSIAYTSEQKPMWSFDGVGSLL